MPVTKCAGFPLRVSTNAYNYTLYSRNVNLTGVPRDLTLIQIKNLPCKPLP